MKLKIIILTFITLIVFIYGAISVYFINERTNFINNSINEIFEKSPSLRWNTRKILSYIDLPVAFVSPLVLEDNLPSFSIIISEKNLDKLDENLPQPIFEGKLTQRYKKSVKAIVIANGEEFKASVRYRGDNYNHWAFSKKSWRIQLQDGYIDGMNVFNFIIPEDRGFVQELFAFRLANRLGLITPKSYYSTLKVNGKRKQVYLLVQHWSDAILEQNKRSTDGVFVGEADSTMNLYKSIDSVKPFSKGSSEIVDLSLVKELFSLLQEKNDEVFFEKLPKVIDIDQTLKWIAHSSALFSRSQKGTHNLVMYINFENKKIEFVPWNITMFDSDPEKVPTNIDYNPFVTRILKNPKWLKKRNQYVLDLIGNKNKLESDLVWIENLKNIARPAVYRDFNKLFLNIEFEIQANKFKKRYSKAHKKLSDELTI